MWAHQSVMMSCDFDVRRASSLVVVGPSRGMASSCGIQNNNRTLQSFVARDATAGHALSVPTHVTIVQALICFLFSFFIYSLCVPYWQQAIIIIFIIFFFFYYVFLQRNSFDTNYRRIILKSYIKYCAQKLYDELVRKKLSEKSS